VKALRPAAEHHPLVWVLIGLWILFVARHGWPSRSPIGVIAFVGGALLTVRTGNTSIGAVIIVVAALSAAALLWIVRSG
jgi:hypothetical protein